MLAIKNPAGFYHLGNARLKVSAARLQRPCFNYAGFTWASFTAERS